ncbi:MAG: glycosyltransferase, partial [Planctomycetota bacterium]
LVSRLTKVRLHDHNCGLKAYRREVLDEVRLYGELHRFVPVLAAARGYRVTEAAVNHRAREHGSSKYGASRLVKGLLDLITVKFLTGYGDRPQHALGGLGLLGFGAGGLGLTYLAIRWVVSRVAPGLEPIHLHETAALYYSLTLCMVGVQFLAVGLLGAMITAAMSEERTPYSVVARTDGATPPEGADLSAREAS